MDQSVLPFPNPETWVGIEPGSDLVVLLISCEAFDRITLEPQELLFRNMRETISIPES